MTNRPRILVADGSKYFAASIWQMLIPENDFDLVGLANNTKEAVSMAGTLAPDIILVDISHSETRGLRGVQNLHAAHPEAVIIIVCLNATAEYERAAVQMGATACLNKSELADSLPKVLYHFASNGKKRTYLHSSDRNYYNSQWTGVTTDVHSN